MSHDPFTIEASLTNPFWQFSLTVYQSTPVKEQCLRLQNSTGVNVNLLLLCCWLAYSRQAITQLELKTAIDSINDWQQQVTQPLRQIRQYLKQQHDALINPFYQQLLNHEIQSEAYQQYWLYSQFESKEKLPYAFDEPLALCYLSWLFSDLDSSMDDNLYEQLKNFTAAVHQAI